MRIDFYGHRVKRFGFRLSVAKSGVLADLGLWFVHVLWWPS